MVIFLVVVLVAVPLIEIAVIATVASYIGIWWTILALLVISVFGATLMKREGMGVLRRSRRVIEAGKVPGRELVDGAMIVTGGALMLTPGFVTDVVGLCFLLPPVRAVVWRVVVPRLPIRVVNAAGQSVGRGTIIDL